MPTVIRRTYTPNRLNQYDSSRLRTALLITYGYNANAKGNLTSGVGWTCGYDQENRLVSASTAGTTVAYVYDPLGRRELPKSFGPLPSSPTAVDRTYDVRTLRE